jgi:hypothetical protein
MQNKENRQRKTQNPAKKLPRRLIYVLKMICQYFERNGDDKNIMQCDIALSITIFKVKV